jgi:hypothetical protein
MIKTLAVLLLMCFASLHMAAQPATAGFEPLEATYLFVEAEDGEGTSASLPGKQTDCHDGCVWLVATQRSMEQATARALVPARPCSGFEAFAAIPGPPPR